MLKGLTLNSILRYLRGWRKRSGIWVKFEPVKCIWIVKK